MALRDIFKKKKTEEKAEKPVKKPEKTPEEKKPPKAETPRVKKESKAIEAYKILKSPQITEKATSLTEKNQYTFKVWPRSNKSEIKKAVENLYGVDVLSVNIVKAPKKERRLGRISGWRKGYKKAIVKIKEGQKIEVLPR